MSYVTFYNCDPKDAPRPTQKTHLGGNAILIWDGKLLLEKRRDSDVWGLIGGGAKGTETGRQAVARETWEELGLRIPAESFMKLQVYGGRGRMAAYRDGSIWRMVIAVYGYVFAEKPHLTISSESKDLKFFTPEEVQNLTLAVTHRDIIEDWFLSDEWKKAMQPMQ